MESLTEEDLCAESVCSLLRLKESAKVNILKWEQLLRNRKRMNLSLLVQEAEEELAAANFNFRVLEYSLAILQSKLSELISETKLGVAE